MKKTLECLANDNKGKVYTIFKFTEYGDVGGIGTDEIEIVPLREYLQTANGDPVDRIDDNTFNIFDRKTGRNIEVKRKTR